MMGLALVSGGTVDVDDIERVMYYREACDKLLGLGTSHGKAAVRDAQAACKTLDFSFLDIEDKRQLLSLRYSKPSTPSNTNTFLEETSMFGRRKKKKKKKKKKKRFSFKKIGKGIKKGSKKLGKGFKKVRKQVGKVVNKPLNIAAKKILGKKNFNKVKGGIDRFKKGINKASKKISKKATKFINKNKKLFKKIGTGIAAAGLVIATAGAALPAMAATAAGTISTAVGAAGSALSAGFAAVQGGVAALGSAVGSAGTALYTKFAEKMAAGPLTDGIIGEDGKYGKWLKDLGEEGKKLTKKGKKAVEKFENSKQEIMDKIDFTKDNIHQQIENIPRRQRAKFERSLKKAVDKTTDGIENVYGQVAQQVTGMQDKLSNTYAQLLMKKDGVDSYVDGLLSSESNKLRRKGENLLAKYTEKGLAEVKFESAAQELKNLERLQLRLINGVTNAVEGVAGQAQQKAEQYAQQTQNLGHQISQSVQQVANNVDQATTAKVDQVSQRVDDLVSKVSQLQGEKADSLVQKAYSNTDVVQQGMASLRALNVLASRAGTTAKEFAKNFDINNETKNAVAMANTIASSRISEQSRNEFVGRPSSSIESEDDGNVEDGEEEENDDQEKENEGDEGDDDDSENEDESLDNDKDGATKDAAQVAAIRAEKRPRNLGMMKKTSAAIATVGATAVLHRSYKNRGKVNKRALAMRRANKRAFAMRRGNKKALPMRRANKKALAMRRAKQLSMKSRKNALLVRRKKKSSRRKGGRGSKKKRRGRKRRFRRL